METKHLVQSKCLTMVVTQEGRRKGREKGRGEITVYTDSVGVGRVPTVMREHCLSQLVLIPTS